MKENFIKIGEKLWNSEKKISSVDLKKVIKNFILNLEKVCRKSVEFWERFKGDYKIYIK